MKALIYIVDFMDVKHPIVTYPNITYFSEEQYIAKEGLAS